MKKINIAIDGYSSCGKGTLAKFLANSLNYLFVDSGAMYRGVALACIENGISVLNEEQVIAITKSLHFSVVKNEANGRFEMCINHINKEKELRSLEVSNIVSEVARIKLVRDELVLAQKAMGKNKGLVMDGRDIGTVVFKDAEVKIFMTANLEIRAKRRYNELLNMGYTIDYEAVCENLKKRDFIDTSRADSPLTLTSEYKVLDNSYLSKEEQNSIALNWIAEAMQTNV